MKKRLTVVPIIFLLIVISVVTFIVFRKNIFKYTIPLMVIIPLIIDSILFVPQQEVFLIERFGKFSKHVFAGLNFKLPIIDRVAYVLSLRIRQLNVDVETKTKDNVFITIIISVQYLIDKNKIYEAAYKLTSVKEQISSYIYDVVRAEVPKLDLDEVFEKKDDLSLAIKNELSEVMNSFGYIILKAPVTDVNPASNVKEAMNEINAAKRLKEAAKEKAEANKITVVKAAEAEAESKRLQGEGIANQRKAIIEGLKDSIEDFKTSLGVDSAQEVMNLVLLTQYFDTLKDMSANSQTNTIMLPHSPSGMNDLSNQIREAVIVGGIVNKENSLEKK